MRTLEEAISEVQRELAIRRRCYGRWVDDGKLSVVDARDRLDRLEAALHYLEAAEHSPHELPAVNAVLAALPVPLNFSS